MEPCRYVCALMGPYKSLSMFIDSIMSMSPHTHPFESLLVIMCPYVSLWILMGSYASLYVLIHFYGL